MQRLLRGYFDSRPGYHGPRLVAELPPLAAWSCSQVGHPRSHNFFVLINADDEERMAEHTEAMMWDCELRTAGSVAHLRVPSC